MALEEMSPSSMYAVNNHIMAGLHGLPVDGVSETSNLSQNSGSFCNFSQKIKLTVINAMTL